VALTEKILADPKLGPVARNIILLWYWGLGQSFQTHGVGLTVSSLSMSRESRRLLRTRQGCNGSLPERIRREVNNRVSVRGRGPLKEAVYDTGAA